MFLKIIISTIILNSCDGGISVYNKYIYISNETFKNVRFTLINTNGETLSINLLPNQTDSIELITTHIFPPPIKIITYFKYKNIKYFEPSTNNLDSIQILFNDNKKIAFSIKDDNYLKTDSFFYGVSFSNQKYILYNRSFIYIFKEHYEITSKIILRPSLYDSAR